MEAASCQDVPARKTHGMLVPGQTLDVDWACQIAGLFVFKLDCPGKLRFGEWGPWEVGMLPHPYSLS